MAFITPPPADFNVAFPGPPGPAGPQGPPGADGAGGASDWTDITGKPSTFPPDPEAVDDRVAALLVAGSNITLSYNDPANTLTIASTGGGGGSMAIGGSITSATAGSVLFAGAAGILAQDNAHFFWDDSSDFLKVGNAASVGAYYLNNLPALYTVPNASGNNWFEGNAGNIACTGAANFATGDQAMQVVTTGTSNIAVGNRSLLSLTTGIFNVAFGFEALLNVTTGQGNFSSGVNALRNCSTGSNNMGFGSYALNAVTAADRNIAIGTSALQVVNGPDNVAIGTNTGLNLAGGSSHNTFIGYNAGGNLTGGIQNVMIGDIAGNLITYGENNTLIGPWQGVASTVNNTIAFSTGGSGGTPSLALDKNFTTNAVWSFNYSFYKGATGLHVYNYENAIPHSSYERAVLDWTITANVFRIGTQATGSGVVRLTAIDGFAKAGAPAAGDLPAGSFALIDDTSAGQTWLCFNKAGTIRKVQLT